MMQVFPSDSSDGKFSDNVKYGAVNAAEIVTELEAEFSNSEDEKIVAVLLRPFGSEENVSLMTQTNLLTAPCRCITAHTK